MMKLGDILKPDQEKPGTYAGVRFSENTVDALHKFCKENKIPKIVPKESLHTTLLYSRKHLPNYEPTGPYDTPMMGEPIGFEFWETQPDDDGETTNCLVLRYSCPELYQRHHKLMSEHGGTYDFDQYKPHVTLSYNVENKNIDKLPEFEGPIEIVEEYSEDLKTNWAKNVK